MTKYAHEAISSGWISSRGPFIEQATEKLKEVFGYKHVLLTSSGTAAGHLVAMSLQHCRSHVQNIFVPNNVYVAAWNTFLQEYLHRALHPVDADLRTWQTYHSNLQQMHDGGSAILVVHNIGGVVNVPALQSRYPHHVIIEDNCEGLFGTYEDKPTGSAAFASSLSFFANKTITSGEGGAFVTSDDDAFAFAKSTANQGQTDERYVHDRMGFNYRMTNVQAALLYGQLVHREQILTLKDDVFAIYRSELPTAKVMVQETESGTVSSNWMMGVRVKGSPSFYAAESFMSMCGIEIRPMFHPITKHKHLRDVQCGSTKVADLLHREAFLLPSYPELTESDQSKIIEAVHDYARSL
ncbi:MAG: DegT/DnrJ/EryC1/StrS family aminotransferase [Gemmatimonadota bacterium]